MGWVGCFLKAILCSTPVCTVFFNAYSNITRVVSALKLRTIHPTTRVISYESKGHDGVSSAKWSANAGNVFGCGRHALFARRNGRRRRHWRCLSRIKNRKEKKTRVNNGGRRFCDFTFLLYFLGIPPNRCFRQSDDDDDGDDDDDIVVMQNAIY